MEVIRFTKGLEQRIQAESDVKTQQIISDGQQEVQRIKKDFETRFANFEKERRAEAESKIAAIQRDFHSELVLKRDRMQFSFKSSAVLSANNEYLGAMSQPRLYQLLKGQLAVYKPAVEGHKLVAKVVDLDVSSVEKVLVEVFGKDAIQSCQRVDVSPVFDSFLGFGDADISNLHRGVILETADGSIRCRATLSELIAPLLENRMEEMMNTLFGEGSAV